MFPASGALSGSFRRSGAAPRRPAGAARRACHPGCRPTLSRTHRRGGSPPSGLWRMTMKLPAARTPDRPRPRRRRARPRTPSSTKPACACRRSATSSPVYVTSPPGDRHRVFVVEQGGQIRVVRRTARSWRSRSSTSRARSRTGGEQGLLSMAFAPDYATSGRFYVYYTDNDGDSRVVEYRRASADRADPGSAPPAALRHAPESNHNGGLLLFGPDGCSTSASATAAAAATSTARAATRRTSARCSARSCASTREPPAAAVHGPDATRS